MTGVIAPTGIWSAEKTITLTGQTKHNQTPSPVSPGFVAPALSTGLIFGPLALAGAIARTATTRDAPADLLASLAKSILPQLECLIADGVTFTLSGNYAHLADVERTLFAARVGAGITDLYMNSLGYVWRANADCLSKHLEPHADFIYEGGNVHGHGVVLAEAHGSFSAKTSVSSVAAQSKRKYKRQVKPYVSKASPHGTVVHGYSVAFGSTPGKSGAFMSVAETRIKKPPKKAVIPPPSPQDSEVELTPTSVALATHRSNFLLMGARPVVEWIDWIRALDELPRDREPVVFLRVLYAGRRFLASPFSIHRIIERSQWQDELWDGPFWWRHHGSSFGPNDRAEPFASGWFVMAETAAEQFLNALSGIIRTGRDNVPSRLELPVFAPVGFGMDRDSLTERDDRDYRYAQYRDGLALLGSPSRRPVDGIRIWSPQDGLHVVGG
jgi:hypothetical protein